jgi:hypothetical protein
MDNILKNFFAVLFLGIFLTGAINAHAGAKISNAHIGGACIGCVQPPPPPVDQCSGTTTPTTVVGTVCTGGAIYAGTGFTGEAATPMDPTVKYMAMPSGCANTTDNPICSGNDTAAKNRKIWADGLVTPSAYNNATPVGTNTIDGPGNTNKLTLSGVVDGVTYVGYVDTYAAKHCQDMVYGGYSNWYLPAKAELKFVLYNQSNCQAGNSACNTTGNIIPGFYASYYWSSTEYSATNAWAQNFNNGPQANTAKTVTRYVRCVRRY